MISLKQIKELQKSKKARDEAGLFVTEGRKLFEEAPKDRIEAVAVTDDYLREHPEIDGLPYLKGKLIALSESRFASIADTKTPQGILTVVRKPDDAVGCETDKEHAPFYVILENLQDPGNLGTVLRTAEAAGADGVFATDDTVDLYSPKTIRSTMGAVYRVPYRTFPSIREIASLMREKGIKTFAAHLGGEKIYTGCDLTVPCAVVIGNEGRGLSDEAVSCLDEKILIPMRGKTESLNAAMAAGIIMYEAARQRGFR